MLDEHDRVSNLQVGGIMEYVSWIKDNWASVAECVVLVIGVASIIVKLTPNVTDDKWLGKIKIFVSKFIALNPK